MPVYHYSSPHLTKGRLFIEESDFVFGINTIAIAAFVFKVRILCYCLMDNHVHILMEGTLEECGKCYKWVMMRIAQMASKRDGRAKRIETTPDYPVEVTSKVQFVREVSYILRNPYKARMSSPYAYKWSSWDVYYNPWIEDWHGITVSSLGFEESRCLFHTRKKLPDQYEHINGRILNKCFVDYKRVQKIIGDSLDLFDTMRLWDLESSVSISHGVEEAIKYTDTELSPKLAAICKNEYHVESLEQLDRKSLLMLARTAARRFGAGKKQLNRLLDISMETLDAVL